jgi:hypothetical protein
MTSDRDTNRIVRSWLENGSTALPDRVLDAVLSELPSTPQRRLRWSPWRTTQMTIRIVALAAILVAILGLALFGAASSRRPAPTPITFSGFVRTLDQSEQHETAVDATATGTTMSGTVVFDSVKTTPLFTLGLECLRRVDDDTWLFGGHVLSAGPNGPPVGHPAAFIVRQGAQPMAGGWFEDEPLAPDCPAFLGTIDLATIEAPNWLWPVVGGDLTIPASVGQ